jgi:hypothetical protein
MTTVFGLTIISMGVLGVVSELMKRFMPKPTGRIPCCDPHDWTKPFPVEEYPYGWWDYGWRHNK